MTWGAVSPDGSGAHFEQKLRRLGPYDYEPSATLTTTVKTELTPCPSQAYGFKALKASPARGARSTKLGSPSNGPQGSRGSACFVGSGSFNPRLTVRSLTWYSMMKGALTWWCACRNRTRMGRQTDNRQRTQRCKSCRDRGVRFLQRRSPHRADF